MKRLIYLLHSLLTASVPTQTHTQIMQEAFSLAGKRVGREADQSYPSSAEINMQLYLHPPMPPQRDASLSIWITYPLSHYVLFCIFCYIIYLTSKCSQHFFSNIHNQCSCLWVRHQDTHPYKTTEFKAKLTTEPK
jgi:hypothetical protein